MIIIYNLLYFYNLLYKWTPDHSASLRTPIFRSQLDHSLSLRISLRTCSSPICLRIITQLRFWLTRSLLWHHSFYSCKGRFRKALMWCLSIKTFWLALELLHHLESCSRSQPLELRKADRIVTSRRQALPQKHHMDRGGSCVQKMLERKMLHFTGRLSPKRWKYMTKQHQMASRWEDHAQNRQDQCWFQV